MKNFCYSIINSGFDAIVRRIRSKRMQNLLYEKCLKLIIENSIPYAPVGIESKSDSQRPMDAFTIRWGKVEQAIREKGAKNLLDVGSAEGYMIRSGAEACGVFSVGIEMDWERIRVGNAQSYLSRGHNYGIIPLVVTSGSIRSLPTFDVVICFSVLHHVIRHHGLDEAHAFLKALAGITGKCFLFDMGSPDEVSSDPEWATVLNFLKKDIPGGVAELLHSAGFTHVRHIADTPGFAKPGIRPLFICDPPKPLCSLPSGA